MSIIDPTTVTPGLPRPVELGIAHYLDADGIPRTVPIYEAGPATNGQRIQAEDIDPTWTFVREELFEPTDTASAPASDSIAAAAATFAESELAVARAAAVDLQAAADKLREAGL